MKKKKIALLSLLFLALFCQAQKDAVRGLFILSAGDTIAGSASAKSLRNHPSSIVIQDEKTGRQTAVFPDQIKSISQADGQLLYQSWNVTLDASYIDKQNLDARKEGDTLNTTLLLQKIYSGAKLDLYYYYSDEKEFYFLVYQGKIEPLHIKYKNRVQQVPTFMNMNMYKVARYETFSLFRDQLLRYFDWQNNQKLSLKVNDLPYEKKQVLRVVAEIDKI